MTRQNRHIARLVMRTAYTVTGFFCGILFAAITHDGLAPLGGIMPAHQSYLIFSAVTWAIAVVIDGLTSEPGHHK